MLGPVQNREPVLHLTGGQPTFQQSRASGQWPALPRLRHVRSSTIWARRRRTASRLLVSHYMRPQTDLAVGA